MTGTTPPPRVTSLADVRTDRSPEMADAVRRVLRQVQRPRVNLGGSGPPGRAD